MGGTWFRSAIHGIDRQLMHVSRHPAFTYVVQDSASVEELQEFAARFVLDEVSRLQAVGGTQSTQVGISFGAAINGHTSEILNASQLWGPGSGGFDLLHRLTESRPDLAWTLINDVSALALYFSSQLDVDSTTRMCVMTVSTGIAARTVETATGRIPLSRNMGLQGEIGHLPVDFGIAGLGILSCDCGAAGHLNAYASGRGILKVMKAVGARVGKTDWQDLGQNPELWPIVLTAGLLRGDPHANQVLDAVTHVLARAVHWIVTVDPEIDRVIICGGVAEGLAPYFEQRLRDHLIKEPMYLQMERQGSGLAQVVEFPKGSDTYPLLGAAIAAEKQEARRTVIRLPPTLTKFRLTENRWTEYEVMLTAKFESSMLENCLMALGAQHALVLIDRDVPKDQASAYHSALGTILDQVTVAAVNIAAEGKDWRLVESILARMEDANFGRRTHVLVALGGGTLLDAAGLAAGLYRRGVPYIRIPTTLLGLVDAGVGVKVGVNAMGIKNRIGLFNPPDAVICDMQFVERLNREGIIGGLGEIVKIGLVADVDLIESLERHWHHALQNSFYGTPQGYGIVERSIRAMLTQLSGNLWESELNRPADLGHSFSQALESLPDPRLGHGKAVAIDIALTLQLGQERGLTSKATVTRVLALMQSLGLPTFESRISTVQLWASLGDATVHRGGRQRLPIVTDIGQKPVFLSDVKESEIEAAWGRLKDWPH